MRWLVAATAFCLVGCQSARSSQQGAAPLVRYEYPAWFVDGTLAPTGSAVGYAPRYETRSLAESLAVRDAAARFRAARGMRYRSEGAFAALGGEPLAFAGERLVVDTLTPEPAVTVIAATVTERMTVALVGASRGEAIAMTRLLPRMPPGWVTSPPRDPRGTVVVGVAEAMYREEGCWDAAESHAIQQLAMSIGIGVKTLAATTSDGQEAVVATRTDVELRELAVLARWRDETRCVVLMRGVGILTGEG